MTDDVVTATDDTGAEIPVYARRSGGMIDIMVRADTRADFRAAAVFYGLISIVDGEVIFAPGVDLDPIGPIVKTPAVMSGDGLTVVTPAVMDNRWHCNMRISRDAIQLEADGTRPKWVRWIVQWHKTGANTGIKNKAERVKRLQSVDFIDPASVATPKRVWL